MSDGLPKTDGEVDASAREYYAAAAEAPPKRRARKRQRIERVQTAAISVARDAIAEGQPAAVVAECCGDENKLALGLELLRAAVELLAREGVWSIQTHVHATGGGRGTRADHSGSRSIQLSVDAATEVDAAYAVLVPLRDPVVVNGVVQPVVIGGSPIVRTLDSERTYRSATVSLGGVPVRIDSRAVGRCARRVNGSQCTGENGHDGDHDFGGGQ